MNFPELLAGIHGLIGILFLIAFGWAFAELVELTHAGIKRVKWGISLMATTSVLLVSSGLWSYIFYRAPVPDSPRSILKAGPTPWVHEILFELKEHIGVFIVPLVLVALYIVFVHEKELRTNRILRLSVAGLLLLAFLITLAVFGMGAYVTKIAPL